MSDAPTTVLPSFRLTDRDQRILATIHAYDGLMSLSQLDRLFFSGKGRTQPRYRLRLLQKHGLLAGPHRSMLHRVPRGETLYWLTPNGARVVAGLQGKGLDDIRWQRKPRVSLFAHHLAINEVRIAVTKACEAGSDTELIQWLPESEFWATAEPVCYIDGAGKRRNRRVIPDGFFALKAFRKQHSLGYLVEVDMGTEDNPRFAREKARPGIAYLEEDIFFEQTGLRHGRWLIITSGQKRLHNMKRQLERLEHKRKFLLTAATELDESSILDKPIWWRPGTEKKMPLLP